MLEITTLNAIEIWIFKALINSSIFHNEFISVNLLRQYDDMKEEIKILKASRVYQRFYCIYKTMLSYCFKCRKDTESKPPKVIKISERRMMFLSKCEKCNNKKSRFIKEQETRRTLNSLELKTFLNKSQC